jgi:hypothetical protein
VLRQDVKGRLLGCSTMSRARGKRWNEREAWRRPADFKGGCCDVGSGGWASGSATRWHGDPRGGGPARRSAGLQRPENDSCGWAVVSGHHTGACPRTGEAVRGLVTHGPQPQCWISNQFKSSKSIQTRSNLFQIISNLIHFKKGLTEIKKFEIKYGFEECEERNNRLHRNSFRF